VLGSIIKPKLIVHKGTSIQMKILCLGRVKEPVEPVKKNNEKKYRKRLTNGE